MRRSVLCCDLHSVAWLLKTRYIITAELGIIFVRLDYYAPAEWLVTSSLTLCQVVQASKTCGPRLCTTHEQTVMFQWQWSLTRGS